MIIAISGAQCTGKTTLINELKKCDFLPKSTIFMGSPSRKANDKGIHINADASILDQLWIYNSYAKDFIETYLTGNSWIVSDRCLVDVLTYTIYNSRHVEDKVSQARWRHLVAIIGVTMLELMSYYDKIIVLKPEFDLVADGVRSTDSDFQREIAQIHADQVKVLSKVYPDKIITDVTGSVEERIEKIKSIVLS